MPISGMLPAAIALMLLAGFAPDCARGAPPQLVFRHVPTRERAVAITINDGPDARIVPAMLRMLQEHGARATFFVTAATIAEDPAILLEIRDAGCEIGNHGYHHAALPRRPRAVVEAEVMRSERMISQAVAQAPIFLRPPYGAVDRQVREVARREGLRIALWDVGDRDESLRRVPARLHPGDIVSLRDDREGLRVLREVLARLDSGHLRGVALREIAPLRP